MLVWKLQFFSKSTEYVFNFVPKLSILFMDSVSLGPSDVILITGYDV